MRLCGPEIDRVREAFTEKREAGRHSTGTGFVPRSVTSARRKLLNLEVGPKMFEETTLDWGLFGTNPRGRNKVQISYMIRIRYGDILGQAAFAHFRGKSSSNYCEIRAGWSVFAWFRT